MTTPAPGSRPGRGHADPHARGAVLPARDLDRRRQPRREAEPRARAPPAAARARGSSAATPAAATASAAAAARASRAAATDARDLRRVVPDAARRALRARRGRAARRARCSPSGAPSGSAGCSRSHGPGRRALVPVVVALVLLPALVAVAAAQPVVVREQLVSERADAQAFVLFDTSLSMRAAAGPGHADAARAREAARAPAPADAPRRADRHRLDDRPLAPEPHADDRPHAVRAHGAAVDRDQPAAAEPGVQDGRATTFAALVPARRVALLLAGRAAAAARRLHRRRVVAGLAAAQADAAPPGRPGVRPRVGAGRADLQPRPGRPPLRLGPAEQAGARRPRRDHRPTALFEERDFGAIARAARDAVGRAGTRTRIDSYARIALAPWFVLAGACRSRSCSGGGTSNTR